MATNVVVIDNGGGFIKAGLGGDRDPLAVVPNCAARAAGGKRWLLADQLLSPSDDLTSAALRRPLDRGYLLHPDLQKEIWQRLLHSHLRLHPSSSSLLLVEPLFNPPALQHAADELVFEDLGFQSLYVADAPSLVHLYEASRRADVGPAARAQCSLVVDCGFSFTHAAPVLQNFTLNYGVKRLDLGGKALTNYLKELVSYRAVNVMDETLIMDEVKEKLCFVSLDVERDLQVARRENDNYLKCTYVLPDGVTHTKGYLKNPEEVNRYLGQEDEVSKSQQPNQDDDTVCLEGTEKPEDRNKIDLTKNEFNLTNERFLVPEMLFHPADLGLNQAGLAECIVRSVHSCHPLLHPVLFESIILTGGCTLFPRFAQRLEKELRPLVPDDYKVKIITQEDPIRGVWRGGSLLASSPDYEAMCVTKAEYEEHGSARCRRRFMH